MNEKKNKQKYTSTVKMCRNFRFTGDIATRMYHKNEWVNESNVGGAIRDNKEEEGKKCIMTKWT